MLGYTVRRILGAIPTLFLIITISFFMVRLAPGGPFDKERKLSPEIEAKLAEAYHMDEPLWMQYGRYMGKLAQGDLGPSFQYKDFTVTELIASGFPISLALGAAAITLAALIGMLAGTWAALRQNGIVDHIVMAFAMTGIAVPSFVMAPLLTLVIGLWLGLLPVGGWGGGSLQYFVLPVIALALPQIAYISRLTRGSMVETLRSQYVRTARAKGLREWAVVLRHTIKGAMLPVVSYLGPAAAGIVTGSVVIEQVFSIPGIGRYFVQAALNRDYTLVMGVVIFYGVLIVTANLIVDLIYGLLDPRVRYD